MHYIGNNHSPAGVIKTMSAIFAAMVLVMQAAHAGQGVLEKQQMIDGYAVTFRVMAAEKGQEMGGSHNVMIKVEKDGKALTDIAVNSKVIYPDGRAETKMMMSMGAWYMAGYDLGQAGKHQLMVLFKTADGAKHKGGIYYPDD
jgi:hypothetical protein